MILQIVNQAGSPIEVFWVNTFDAARDLVPQTKKPLRNNTDAKINSYNGHQFQAKFLNHIPGTEVSFTKGPEEETFTIKYDDEIQQLVAIHSSSETEVMDMISKAIESCNSKDETALNKCVTEAITEEVERILTTKSVMEEYRDKMSSKLRNYTCADPKMQNSEPIRTHQFNHLDKRYSIKVLLDQDRAKIWTVDNFITEKECKLLMDHARPNLSKATVASEDGSSSYSENRKAQQAHYDINFEQKETDPLW